MKLLLLIGATLMTGAGIYGFVDYKKKEQNKDFNALYNEEKPVIKQLTPEIVTSPAPVIAVNAISDETVVKTKSSTRKKGKHKKKIGYVLFSRAAPRDLSGEDMELAEPEPPVKQVQ